MLVCGHRTKKHHPARLSGVVCCPRRRLGAFLPRGRHCAVNLLRLLAKAARAIQWHGYCSLGGCRGRLNDENDSRLHPHSICLRRDPPRPRVAIGRMIARLYAMKFAEFKKAGHWPTLLAAFLYFDISFMAWVALGPLMVYIAHDMNLAVSEKFTLVAIPGSGRRAAACSDGRPRRHHRRQANRHHRADHRHRGDRLGVAVRARQQARDP